MRHIGQPRGRKNADWSLCTPTDAIDSMAQTLLKSETWISNRGWVLHFRVELRGGLGALGEGGISSQATTEWDLTPLGENCHLPLARRQQQTANAAAPTAESSTPRQWRSSLGRNAWYPPAPGTRESSEVRVGLVSRDARRARLPDPVP